MGIYRQIRLCVFYDAKMENTAVFIITAYIDYTILTMLPLHLNEKDRGKQVLPSPFLNSYSSNCCTGE